MHWVNRTLCPEEDVPAGGAQRHVVTNDGGSSGARSGDRVCAITAKASKSSRAVNSGAHVSLGTSAGKTLLSARPRVSLSVVVYFLSFTLCPLSYFALLRSSHSYTHTQVLFLSPLCSSLAAPDVAAWSPFSSSGITDRASSESTERNLAATSLFRVRLRFIRQIPCHM
jgi:hypothetical protein